MRVTPPNQRVADNIRAEMARRQITQTTLATQLGRTQQAISRRLSGQTPFTIEDAAAIADILGVPLVSLLCEDAA